MKAEGPGMDGQVRSIRKEEWAHQGLPSVRQRRQGGPGRDAGGDPSRVRCDQFRGPQRGRCSRAHGPAVDNLTGKQTSLSEPFHGRDVSSDQLSRTVTWILPN